MPSENREFIEIRTWSKSFRREKLMFNSEHLRGTLSFYVAWIDMMGAGHLMSTSVHKSANNLARLHMAVHRAKQDIGFIGHTYPINDGIFILCESKKEIMSIVGCSMAYLAANFIAVDRPHDRFLVRGSIAYGPVYLGAMLVEGLQPRSLRENPSFIESLMFGPSVIEAYQHERAACPYGISIAPSARAFAPAGETPFRMLQWMWWARNEAVYPKRLPPLVMTKECLASDLTKHFTWMKDSLIYHGLEKSKIDGWLAACTQYFSLG